VIAAVTGATGFVGRALVAALVAEGYTMRALVRPGVAPDRRARIEHLGAELVPGDLGDEGTVERLVRGADVVFHAAAAVGAWQPRALCEAVNLVGTEVLLDACRAGGAKRLVYVSCASVTAGLGHRRYVDESHPHPARFPDAYHSTKALAEDLVVAASGSGFDSVVVRPGLVWGPDDTSSLVRMLGLAAQGALPLVDDGEALAATTYIVNLVDVLLRAATRPEAPGQVYFVTDDEMVRQRVFVTRLLRGRRGAGAAASGALLAGVSGRVVGRASPRGHGAHAERGDRGRARGAAQHPAGARRVGVPPRGQPGDGLRAGEAVGGGDGPRRGARGHRGASTTRGALRELR
jgi:nucleoside-diphosphate-sugar epimerase